LTRVAAVARPLACFALALVPCLSACGDGGVVLVNALGDASMVADASERDSAMDPDASMVDAGADSGTGTDAGVDASCDPPAPTRLSLVDTGGPAGESVSACLARVGGLTDTRTPMDQGYVLTTFGGGADTQPVACAGAPDADGTWYYLADAQRLNCGLRMRLVDASRTHCVIAEVADVGPNACVEEAAGRPVMDASPLVAQALFSVSSAGYSERRELLAAPVGSANALGPCDLGAESDRLRGFVGGSCDVDSDCTFTGGRCLRPGDGYPGGLCTTDCTASCPDRAGANAYTGCAAVGSQTLCLARCDFTLFATGCRPGYGCETRPSPSGSADRDVCLPLVCL